MLGTYEGPVTESGDRKQYLFIMLCIILLSYLGLYEHMDSFFIFSERHLLRPLSVILAFLVFNAFLFPIFLVATEFESAQ